MEALKLIKKIENTSLEELSRFKGEIVEIIIFRYDQKEKNICNKQKAFDIIKKYSQNIPKWTREELYDR